MLWENSGVNIPLTVLSNNIYIKMIESTNNYQREIFDSEFQEIAKGEIELAKRTESEDPNVYEACFCVPWTIETKVTAAIKPINGNSNQSCEPSVGKETSLILIEVHWRTVRRTSTLYRVCILTCNPLYACIDGTTPSIRIVIV